MKTWDAKTLKTWVLSMMFLVFNTALFLQWLYCVVVADQFVQCLILNSTLIMCNISIYIFSAT